MVVKGESPRSEAKVPDADSYGGGGKDFNLARQTAVSIVALVGAAVTGDATRSLAALGR